MKIVRESINESLEALNWVNESLKTPIIAWHTSEPVLKDLSTRPMWFTTKLKWAKAYHRNTYISGYEVHTYKATLHGNILTQNEAKELAEKLGMNYRSMITDLTTNPTMQDVYDAIQNFPDYCDGFEMWDYDPNDSVKDATSIIIFNPSRSVKIIKEISFIEKKPKVKRDWRYYYSPEQIAQIERKEKI